MYTGFVLVYMPSDFTDAVISSTSNAWLIVRFILPFIEYTWLLDRFILLFIEYHALRGSMSKVVQLIVITAMNTGSSQGVLATLVRFVRALSDLLC